MPFRGYFSDLNRGVQLLTHLGPGWAVFRARYALQKRTGALRRRTPPQPWVAIAPKSVHLLSGIQPPAVIGAGCLREAEDIVAGRFRLFSSRTISTDGFPNWHRNQVTGEEAPANAHWSTLGDFRFGDIKAVWELSRFSWAFALARAYGRSGDNRFAERYWALFEDWMQRNPPNLGPNWMCGQEASFRLFAAAFATTVLAKAPPTIDERLSRFSQFVIATGRRISVNLDYALSQSNNHGISECVGLITAATLVPDSPESNRWLNRGMAALRRQLQELVYPDGGFAQHSAIYHRVLLHDLLWCTAVLRSVEREVPAWLSEPAARTLGFIETLMDPRTGEVALYGANDGANILPLADAEFLDFRPTIQAAHAVLDGTRPLSPGPWDEMADWLGGAPRASQLSVGNYQSEAAASPNNQQRVTDNRAPDGARHFPDAGCLLWHSGDTRLFFRCPTRFRHRPSQADLLHVDISWHGKRIAHDAGTFSYNSPRQFACALKSAAVHNSITFDGGEPMEKVGRFLYLPWPRGSAGWQENGCEFAAEHDGWRKLGVGHVRHVSSPASSTFLIRDEVTATGQHTGRIHWLLADVPYVQQSDRIILRTEAGEFQLAWSGAPVAATLARADPTSNRGWWSPYYCEARPALSLALEFEFTANVSITTRFSPVSHSVSQ